MSEDRGFRLNALSKGVAVILGVVLLIGACNSIIGGNQETASKVPAEDKARAGTEPVEETTTKVAMSETTRPTASAASSAPSTASAPEAQEEGNEGDYDATVTVTRVVDGDTIRISPTVDGIEEVRLIGVDTPETKEPGCAVQPYGTEASKFTASELQGEEISLEFDEDREDRYDRLLAYVHKDGEMFNETLLEEGYAQVYTVSPNDRYEDRFEEAQAEARAAERGIWTLSAAQQAELTDRDNGIGSDGCAEEAAPAQTPTQQPGLTPGPQPASEPEPDVPSVPSTPAPETPSAPAPGSGVDCSAGARDIPVPPGSKGDRDRDGVACES